jgi:hypothetical protein
MKYPFFVIFLLISPAIFCKEKNVVHVFVALCDNENQGIVRVPEKIGNGQDPDHNLYWGCRYGVKTYFSKLPDWKLVSTRKKVSANILERCVFKNLKTNTFLVADAYDGKTIKQTIVDFLMASSGNLKSKIVLGKDTLCVGGSAQLLCYVGHNGLMEFSLDQTFKPEDNLRRQAIVLACASFQYFQNPIDQTGAEPFLLTTNLMSPEAYTLDTAIDSWLKKEDAAVVRKRVAETYDKNQKCGFKGAYRLFKTQF